MRGDLTDPEPPDQESAERRRTVLIVVGTVVVLAVVGLVVFLMTRPDAEETAGDPEVPTISGQAPSTAGSGTPRPEPPAAPVSSGSAEVEVPSPPSPENQEVASARSVVEDAIAAINGQDVGAMEQLACDPASVGQADDLQPGVRAVLQENPQVTGDKATAQVELNIEGMEPTVVPLPLQKRADGSWCVP